MMGGRISGGRMISAEEGAVMVDELEATAPAIDQHYPDSITLAIRSALTDADLFVSYNMPAKALVPLLAALPQAPRDVRLNQRLAALHTRAERFAEAGVCCRTLESVYSDAGYPDEAVRYGELASKYEERTGATQLVAPQAEETESAAASWPADVAVEEPSDTLSPAAEFPVHDATQAAPEFVVQDEAPLAEPVTSDEASEEFDLSGEWEGAGSTEPASAAEPESAVEVQAATPASQPEAPSRGKAVAERIEEIRFYLSHFMHDQARAAMSKLEKLTRNPAVLATVRAEIAIAEAESGPEAEPEAALAEEIEAAPSSPTPPPSKPAPFQQPAASSSGVLDDFVSDLESSLGEGFLPETPKPEARPVMAQDVPTKAAPPAPARSAPVAGEHKAGVLGEFVADLEAALPDSFLQEAPAPQADARFDVEPKPQPISASAHMTMAASASASAPAPTAPPVIQPAAPAGASPSLTYKETKIRSLGSAPGKFSAAGVDLAEMFGELKQEMEEEVATSEEDPETHYNLGVAFREMGLLDEAIGELQKVCQAVEHGHAFPQIMQTYTWLAQCFLDKGVPEAAIRWYEKALKLPSLDADTRMALHYELASAYEVAKNKPAALNHFMEVYGSNIDYRDVAERINALKS